MTWKLMENAITFSDKLKLIKFILTNDKFTNGERVKQLESEWNQWLGCENSLFVSSGSTANFLLIAAIKEFYGLKNGDKVLVPACTWMTNVAPIIQLGLTPVFCDVKFSDFSFDFEDLKYISKKHPDIKLIFVTHLLGFSSESRIQDIFSDLFPKSVVIDDVCESHGCKDNQGNKVGSNSIGATFSTYFGHHLTSIEGGFVSTNNYDLYDLMKMKRSHGLARESIDFNVYAKLYSDIDKSFLFITDGYNFRNTELNAVLGSSQLKNLDNSISVRNSNYKKFCDITNNFDSIIHPIAYKTTSSNFCFPLIFNNLETKQKVGDLFNKYNIEYRPIVSGNLLRHPFLKNKKYKICSKKKEYNIDKIHDFGLYLGNSQFVGDKQLELLQNILKMV